MNKEQKNKKLKAIIILIILIIAIITIYCIINAIKTASTKNNDKSSEKETQVESLIDLNKTENVKIENNEKENVSNELKKEKTFEGMTIKDIQLKTNEGVTQFIATVENNSGSDYAGGKVVIHFTNKNGEEYALVNGILPSIANGESNSIIAGTTEDVANAYNFSIQKSQ